LAEYCSYCAENRIGRSHEKAEMFESEHSNLRTKLHHINWKSQIILARNKSSIIWFQIKNINLTNFQNYVWRIEMKYARAYSRKRTFGPRTTYLFDMNMTTYLSTKMCFKLPDLEHSSWTSSLISKSKSGSVCRNYKVNLFVSFLDYVVDSFISKVYQRRKPTKERVPT
jgi:hypothetical protein